jgi:long-chain fatty acid transport protein
MTKQKFRNPAPLICLSFSSLLFISSENNSCANGIYGNGIGADAMSMGGAEVAWAADPLSAMTANPAGLGFLSKPEIDLGAEGAVLEGNFVSKTGSGGGLNSSLNALPEGAFAYPLKSVPITFGLSVAPQAALLANWNYVDPPGGLGGNISYGDQEEKSEIILLRSALGVAWQITPQISVGASAGLLYNQNDLVAPYIFQNLQPASAAAYNGAKTLLNLHTSGFGGDGTVGALFRATTNLQFGVFYQSESIINTSGNATGNPYAQFGGASLPFHYDAEVKNKFPQNASVGVSWRFLSQFRASAQVDWIDWADAFDTLHIGMNNGNNSTVNSVLGTSSFRDNFPLNWSSEFVYRIGLEYDVTENLALRIGYCYGQSPVPDSTLTPMTAAITENTITAGVGYHWSRYKIEIAYQYYLPATQNVGQSGLLSGEYSNSSTTVSAHVLAITTAFTF